MPEYADGYQRVIVLAEESTFGTQASGPGQIIRRANFTLEDQLPEAQSQLVLPDAQAIDGFVGVPSVVSTIVGEAAPGTYKQLFEGVTRGTWTAGPTVSAKADTALTTSGTAITLTSASSNYLTSNIKIGHTVRLSGITSTQAALNNVNLLVNRVTATVLTFAPNALAVAWASGQAAVTVTVPGKTLIQPLLASQVLRSYTMEDWDAIIARSRLGLGLKVGSIGLAVQPNGFVNLQASMIGKRLVRSGTRVYGSPTAESPSDGIRPVNGTVVYDRFGSPGIIIGYITGFNVQIAQVLQPVPTIGASDGPPKISGGMMSVRGTVTMLTTDDNFDDDFFQQNDVEVTLNIPNSAAVSADFLALHLPRMRLVSAQRQDSDRATIRSYGFAAYRKTSGGAGSAYQNSSVMLQDTLA